jgi:Family of unknown function (DUF6491)
MPTLARLTAIIPVAMLLAGCVAPAPSKQEVATEATYLKYSGPLIDSFSYLGPRSHDGFEILGNKQVVIWTTLNDAYLIQVREPCYNLHLANRVAVTSTARTVNRNFDYVLADHLRCRIDTIRHIDYAAFKQARGDGSS